MYTHLWLHASLGLNVHRPVVAGQPGAGEDDVPGLAELVGHRQDLRLGVGEGACQHTHVLFQYLAIICNTVKTSLCR